MVNVYDSKSLMTDDKNIKPFLVLTHITRNQGLLIFIEIRSITLSLLLLEKLNMDMIPLSHFQSIYMLNLVWMMMWSIATYYWEETVN